METSVENSDDISGDPDVKDIVVKKEGTEQTVELTQKKRARRSKYGSVEEQQNAKKAKDRFRIRSKKTVGSEMHRWENLKKQCGDRSDPLFAKRLLDSYEHILLQLSVERPAGCCPTCGKSLEAGKQQTQYSEIQTETHDLPMKQETHANDEPTSILDSDEKHLIQLDQDESDEDVENIKSTVLQNNNECMEVDSDYSVDDFNEMLNVLETYEKAEVEVDVESSCRVTSSGRPVRRAAAVASKRQSLLMALETDDTTATTVKVTDTQKTAGDKEKPKGKKIPADPEKEWEKLEFDDYQTDGSDESMSSTEDQACVDDLHMSKELLSNSNMDGTITECLWCDFTCEIDSEMQQHRLKEHNLLADGEFQCDICHEVFSSWRKFRSHKEKEHETKFKNNVMCDLCGMLVTSKLWSYHIRVDCEHVKGEYICEFCGKVYSKRSIHIYKLHVKSHTEPLKCKVPGCDTILTTRSLKTHMLDVHEKERNHVCTECGKGFFGSYNLKVHMRQHSGDHPFRCNLCDYKAKQKICLKLHMKSNHPGEGEHLL